MPFPKRSSISRSLLSLSILGAATIPAIAQDAVPLDGAQLDALLRGHTLYITVPQGTVPFHYGADGAAAARLPNGLLLKGAWSVGDSRYCVDWDNGPKNSCTAIRKTHGALELYDTDKNVLRGTVERIVPGDPENL